MPGCPHCKRIWDDLDRVAAAIRQRLEGRASITRSSRFDATLTSSRWPDGTPRDEVRLALSIRHRAGYFEPVDHCERTCLEDIVGTLRFLGARQDGVT
jgi:hypothetical protein